MNFITIAQLVLTGIIISILVLASKEDLKYNRITKRNTIFILIFTLLYTLVYPTYGIERTVAFVIAFSMFGGMTLLSHGKFGFGDAIIIAALALYIGKVQNLGYFFSILGFTALSWGVICIVNTQLTNKDKTMKQRLRDSFHIVEVVSIENALPGMILFDDYFMTGLTEDEILDLKKKGITSIKIKRAYPFIPVIFVAFIIYLIVVQYHLI